MYKTIARISRTFLTFAETSGKWLTQEDKQEAPEDEDHRQMHSSGQPAGSIVDRKRSSRCHPTGENVQ